METFDRDGSDLSRQSSLDFEVCVDGAGGTQVVGYVG